MEDFIKIQKRDRKLGRQRALGILSAMAGVGIICIISYSIIINSPLFAGATTLVAFAAAVSGGLSGFLFGIPKTNQYELNGIAVNGNAGRKEASIHYQFNTNLEQISDWLTKILIGVGLTQLHAISNILHRYSKAFVIDMAIIGHGAASVITVSIIYFLICGFMIGYLWTRLFYHRLLATADRGFFDTLKDVNMAIQETKEQVQETKVQVQETKEQVKKTKDQVKETKEETANIKTIAESAISAATFGVGKLNTNGVAPEIKNKRISLLKEGFGKAVLPQITNPEDPNKGRFGGKSQVNGRCLTAEIKPSPGNESYYNVQLCVESASNSKPLTGMVRFYLHDSFREPIVDIQVKDGLAQLDPVAFSAFTVGAIADDGETLLELDLRELANAPKNFKNR